VYRPLARVGFFNPKDLAEKKVEIPEANLPVLYKPADFQMRTIYCYVTLDEDEAWWNGVISAGYQKWCDQKMEGGHYEQMGLENSVSPSPSQTSAPASRQRALEPRQLESSIPEEVVSELAGSPPRASGSGRNPNTPRH